ncbi:MAG: CvpA family protein [Pseudomonas sp.]|nr:CvpA family protein [Pseudomonas sp.]
MSGVDWVVLAIVAASALFGLMRGFVGMLVSLVAWLLSGWVAFRFGGEVGRALAGTGEPSAGQVFAGYALSFIVVMVVVGAVGWLVRKLVASTGLGGMDRLLGLGIGVARGAFVACALVLLLGLTSLPREPEWQSSRVVPVFVPGALWLRAWLPDWVAARVDFGGAHDSPAPADPLLPAPLAG